MLHSCRLVFPAKLKEPFSYLSGQEFTAPLPEAFKKVIDNEVSFRL